MHVVPKLFRHGKRPVVDFTEEQGRFVTYSYHHNACGLYHLSGYRKAVSTAVARGIALSQHNQHFSTALLARGATLEVVVITTDPCTTRSFGVRRYATRDDQGPVVRVGYRIFS